MGRLAEWKARVESCDRLALDTNAVIYFLDRTQPYAPFVEPIFARAEDGLLEIVLSALVETELLVGPLRSDEMHAVEAIRLLLDHFPGLSVAPIDRAVAQEAARLRAQAGLSTPDALIAATALSTGCRLLVGNDRTCAARLMAPEYLLLADYT